MMQLLHTCLNWLREQWEFAANRRYMLHADTTLFEKTLHCLRNEHPELREKAARDLTEWMERGVTVAQGLQALRFAAQPFPPRLESTWRGYDVLLVEVAQTCPDVGYVDVIREYFPMYSIEARWEALILIGAIPDRGAAYTYTDLLGLAMRQHGFNVLPVAPLGARPRFADIIFPDLFAYLDEPNHAESVWSVTLRYCEEGLLDAGMLAGICDRLLQDYVELKELLFAAQRQGDVSWMWNEPYSRRRFKAALLLDLMGHVPGEAVVSELVEALSYADPRLTANALISLVRQDRVPRFHHWVGSAQAAETRNVLFDRLRALDREDLFPIEYATQDAFAESDMVGWLLFPTELGRVPDEIELMRVETIESEEDIDTGPIDVYLFRFRVKEPHWASEKGWMAGVAGPFPKYGPPSTAGMGATFSCFESWESRTPDEHLESILGLFDSRS